MAAPTASDELVREFLNDLSTALRPARPASRKEFLSEIEEHISEGRTALEPNDLAGVRTLLERLGPPRSLAVEFLGPEASTPVRDLDRATPWLLALGGLFGGVGWLFGLYGVWTSKVWRPVDKVLGSLIFPGGIAIFLFTKASSDSAACVSRMPIRLTCPRGEIAATMIVSFAALACIFFRLLWVLYRKQES